MTETLLKLTAGHRGHKVLGHYCWDCRCSTTVGVPGWLRTSRSDGPHVHQDPVSVTWLDGSRDAADAERNPCIMCHSNTCIKPVHNERYTERLAKVGE